MTEYNEDEYLTPSGHCRVQDQRLLNFCGNGMLMRGMISAAAGTVLGVIVSLIVNVALVELSLSPFFAVYFGLLFIAVGILILWRISIGQSADPDEQHQRQLVIFACLVIFSGIICFFLGRTWFVKLPWIVKIPVYSILGTAVAFALTFTFVDILNVISGIFQSSAAKPLVQSVSQIRLVVSIAVLMGAIFGTIFGLMDIEENIPSVVRLALLREEHYCYPIGAVLGAVAGFGNEYLRHRRHIWQKLQQSDFDEDI